MESGQLTPRFHPLHLQDLVELTIEYSHWYVHDTEITAAEKMQIFTADIPRARLSQVFLDATREISQGKVTVYHSLASLRDRFTEILVGQVESVDEWEEALKDMFRTESNFTILRDQLFYSLKSLPTSQVPWLDRMSKKKKKHGGARVSRKRQE